MPAEIAPTPAQEFEAAYNEALGWLQGSALPLWASNVSVDATLGGFFEKVGHDGVPIDGPRRTRVVGRQIYAFLAAGRMGWTGDVDRLVEHGLEALYTRCLTSNGLVVSTYRPGGGVEHARFDFYDHAFALFALGQAASRPKLRAQALSVAERMLSAMRVAHGHPHGGFREDDRGHEPLRANPHMHMLEACLELRAVPGAGPEWQACADEIVALAMTRFIDLQSGSLRELFDFDWVALPDEAGQLIEPGHQFEWAWLLRRWNVEAADAQVERAASRLIEVAERHGIGNAGLLVVNALDTRLSIVDPAYRLWPQTERLKAAVQSAEQASDQSVRDQAYSRAVNALSGMQLFLKTDIPGLWHDRLDPAGSPIRDPAPASTLYHVICALEVCHATKVGGVFGD